MAVVRSAPDLSRFVRQQPDPSLRRGKPYLLAYLGVMGPQDGVDYALRALQLLRDEIGRDDIHCIFMGAGDAFDEMVALSEQLGVADIVEFPGRVADEFVQRCLSTADVCLSPDPLNPLNDVSTMNKVVEYMAMGRPIVSFDLVEARVSAGDAAVYVRANDELAFAQAIDALLQRSRPTPPDGRIGTQEGRSRNSPGRCRVARLSSSTKSYWAQKARDATTSCPPARKAPDMGRRIAVFGTGYLGATHAACMAELGHEVLGVDVDLGKLAKLSAGEAPFYEPGLDKVLKRNVDAGRLRFTSSYSEAAEFADVHFIAVATPQKQGEFAADLRYVDAVIETLAPLLTRPAVIFGKSTVPVGTAARLATLVQQTAPAGDEVEVAWNPEFLREGYAVKDTLHPDRIVVGVDRSRHGQAEDVARDVYRDLVGEGIPFLVTDRKHLNW